MHVTVTRTGHEEHVLRLEADAPAPEEARLLADLRNLGVDVHGFLFAAAQAERYAQAHADEDLPELIRRDCLDAPSVLLRLRFLRILIRDDEALRRVGEALATPSRARKNLLTLERLEHLETLARRRAGADNMTMLRTSRDRVAREAGLQSGKSLLRRLQAERKKHRKKISPSSV